MVAAGQQVTAGPTATNMAMIWLFVRGVHAYNNKPRIGEILCLQRQAENSYTQFTVAVMNNGTVIGHVPRRLALIFSPFLKRKDICGDHGGKLRGWTWC